MKVPTLFVKDQEELEVEVKKIVKKTLVDKVLLEDFAKELTAHLEGELIAKRIEVVFYKNWDLTKDKIFETETEREHFNYKIRDNIRVVGQNKFLDKLRLQEQTQILNYIREIEPSIRNEDIIIKPYCLDIISKNMIYKLSLSTGTSSEHVSTDITIPFKNEKEIVKLLVFKRTVDEKIDKSLEKVYHNPRINGNIQYVKFDQEHNQKLIKFLQGKGYEVHISIKDK